MNIVKYNRPYNTKIKHPNPTLLVMNLDNGLFEIKPNDLSKTYLF